MEGVCGWRRPRARRGHGLGPQGQRSGLQVAGHSGLGTHPFLRGWGARGVLEGATSASRGRMEGVGPQPALELQDRPPHRSPHCKDQGLQRVDEAGGR